MDGRALMSEESREPVTLFVLFARHPCLFPRRPTARVTFLSGKVTKAIGAGMAVSPTSGWLRTHWQAAFPGSLPGPHILVRAFASAADAIQGIG
jgi:hypothetical protein